MPTETAAARAPLAGAREAPDFAALRAREFARLDDARHAYLDFTGSALYPDSLVARHLAMLRGAVLGNPHSESPASISSSLVVADARARVLRFLDADPDEYEVAFTANATAAIALVAHSFPFGPRAPYVLTVDNHNSVNGIREHAARAGAPVHYLPLDAELRLDQPSARLAELSRPGDAGLFAFPAQSNFSGVRHPLSLVRQAQSLGWRVLLDAAAYLPTSRLSLRETPADFVVLSHYKLVGYPTGVGALVARRESLARLRRPWFSGGTVDYVSVQLRSHLMRHGAEGFEDGTANFLALAALPAGFDFLESIGIDAIGRHVSALATRLVGRLVALRHANGAHAVRIYGPVGAHDRGATVAFNLLDAAGVAVPFATVETAAREANVSVRTGCFCNPGASEVAFGFPPEVMARCLDETAARGWSLDEFARCMRGYPVGAVRASFGIPSNEEDVERLMAVIQSIARA